MPTHLTDMDTILQLSDTRVKDCNSDVQSRVSLRGSNRRVMSTIDLLVQLGLLERDMVSESHGTQVTDADSLMHKFYHVKRSVSLIVPHNAPTDIRAEAQGRTYSFGGDKCDFNAYWKDLAGGFVHAWSVEGREDSGGAPSKASASEVSIIAQLSKKRMWVSFTDVALTPEISAKALDVHRRITREKTSEGPPSVDLANAIADEINVSREAVARHIRYHLFVCVCVPVLLCVLLCSAFYVFCRLALMHGTREISV
jgi:hypothetical protein